MKAGLFRSICANHLSSPYEGSHKCLGNEVRTKLRERCDNGNIGIFMAEKAGNARRKHRFIWDLCI